jgi:antitoxin (DNA-binding transcriptional repressor) of toxin-antitoxin stability system
MQTVQIGEMKAHLSEILERIRTEGEEFVLEFGREHENEVEQGQEVRILRRGHPIAQMTRPEDTVQGFRSRADLRQELPPAHEEAAQAMRAIRDAERF